MHILSAASPELERKGRQLSQYLWHSEYDFLRLFMWLFLHNCLYAFFFLSSLTSWFFLGSWDVVSLEAFPPLFALFYIIGEQISFNFFSFFFNWKTVFLLSRNSKEVNRPSRPIYLGDETKQAKFQHVSIKWKSRTLKREIWSYYTAITWVRNPGVLI